MTGSVALTAPSPAYRRPGLKVLREKIAKVSETIWVAICSKEAIPVILKMGYSNARSLKSSPHAASQESRGEAGNLSRSLAIRPSEGETPPESSFIADLTLGPYNPFPPRKHRN